MAQLLIVDDDADIRAVLQLVVEEAGYEADLCDGADVALVWLRAHADATERAIVFVDDHMPGMTGRSLLEVIAQDDTLRGAYRYVLMTADTQAVRLAEGAPTLRTIIAAVLVKPFDLDELLNLIARLAVDGDRE